MRAVCSGTRGRGCCGWSDMVRPPEITAPTPLSTFRLTYSPTVSGLKTDSTGRYSAMYKPYHLIGLELGISVASIMVRGEPTGTTREFRGDVVATAKRDLKPGERLDGEGGFMAYGKLMPAHTKSQ